MNCEKCLKNLKKRKKEKEICLFKSRVYRNQVRTVFLNKILNDQK